MRRSAPTTNGFIFLATCLFINLLATGHALADAPTYSLTLSGGSFSPNPLVVDMTQPAPGAVSSTATVTGDVEVNNPNEEYEKNKDDQWNYSPSVTGYSATSAGSFGSLNGITSPSVSGGSSGTITATANQNTTPGYYQITITATDQFTVTDSATDPATMISENPQPATITLMLIVAQVDITGLIQNVIVGEQVHYQITIVPFDLTQPPFQVTKYLWAIPGTTSDRVTAFDTENATYVPVSSNKTVSATISGHPVDFTALELIVYDLQFYWVSGGSHSISCAVSLAGTSCNPQRSISVASPTAYISVVSTGKIGVGVYFESDGSVSDSVYDGINFPGSYAVDFAPKYAPPTGFSGRIQWVQTVSASDVVTEAIPASNPPSWYRQISGLDTFYPAPMFVPGSQEFIDAPDLPLSPFWPTYITEINDVSSAQMNQYFTTYLEFQPEDANGNYIPSIFVPVANISWQWVETAIAKADTNGNYSILTLVSPADGIPPLPTGGGSSTVWPDWSNISNNFQWVKVQPN